MSIEKMIKESMDKDPMTLKESIQEELRSRIASALEEKFAKKTDKDDDGEGMDPVDKKASKKDFDDREDKDLDNDGDTDDSDEYLHKRRKAIGKSIGKKKVDEAKSRKEREVNPDMPIIATGRDVSKNVKFRKKFRNMPAMDKWMDSDAFGDFDLEHVFNEAKLTDADFKKDMSAVKAGKADAGGMADKWGSRGGAFLNLVKKK
jgi:hypothetical protein